MKTATLALPGGMYDYLEDTNIWNEDFDAGSVATVNALNNGKVRRYGKGYTVTIEVTKAVADTLGTYADAILASGDEFTPAERKAAQVTFDRIEALAFTEKETEPTTEPEATPEPVADETPEEAAVRRSVDAAFPVVAKFLADERTKADGAKYAIGDELTFQPTRKDTFIPANVRVIVTKVVDHGPEAEFHPGGRFTYVVQIPGIENATQGVGEGELEPVADETGTPDDTHPDPIDSPQVDNKGEAAMTETKKAPPKTKAARHIEPGDWVTFGNLSYSVHAVEISEEDGTVWLAIGHAGTELKLNERVTMHYDD
ncbi:hypothetical protein AB0N93_21055 [Streptomyces sp. NPDC091267]|uniref:hypothetical protein n=1 Tax=Streptomyces sp. NPDC091267 TaxID=3155195 RepID=UPI003448ACA9